MGGGTHFRAGVVLVVRRADGQVMAFERAGQAGQWQLPQGGIEHGETPEQAAWRELVEETGLGPDAVQLVGEFDDWTVYEWPADVRDGRRLGQAHRWFFFAVNDERVEPRPDGREFGNWRWADVDWLLETVVDFRRQSYRRVLG